MLTNPALVYITRAIALLSPIISIIYIITLLKNPSIWRTDPYDSDDEKKSRVQLRGTLTSLLTGIALTVVSIIMVLFKVQENDIEILFGFLLTPVIGYLTDISIGTDVGLNLLKTDTTKSFKYAMESIASPKFLRYAVTFLLDLFITKPIAAVFKGYSIFTLGRASPSIWLDKFILKNITGITQSIISIITFQAYGNQTRFLWAFPDPRIPKSKLINSFSIMIAVAISASFYLITYSTEANALGLNLMLVFSACLLITTLVYTNHMDVSVDEELDVPRDNKKYYSGLIIFVLFLLVGLVAPFLRRIKNVVGDIDIRNKITDPNVLRVIQALEKK